MKSLFQIIFVIILVIIVMYGFFVIIDVNDNLSSVIIQVNRDKTTVTEIPVTMTKMGDKSATMTEKSDKNGFVTFNNMPNGFYIIQAQMKADSICLFPINLDRRIYTYKILYESSSKECELIQN